VESGALRVEESSAGVSRLVIDDVRRSFAGQLSCSAHNDAGSANANFTVVVHCKQHLMPVSLALITVEQQRRRSALISTSEWHHSIV